MDMMKSGQLAGLIKEFGDDSALGLGIPGERAAELILAVNAIPDTPALITATFETALRLDLQLLLAMQGRVLAGLTRWAGYAIRESPADDVPSIVQDAQWMARIEKLQLHMAKLAEVYGRLAHLLELNQRSETHRKLIKLHITPPDQPIPEAGQDQPAASEPPVPQAQAS